MTSSNENLACISHVANLSKERSGGFPGFDCVLIYLEQDLLIELYPNYQGTILQDIKTFIKKFFTYIKANNLSLDFIKKALFFTIKENSHLTATILANKILAQIYLDEKIGKSIRRPTYYVSVGEKGFAIAICIDDRFWTDNW